MRPKGQGGQPGSAHRTQLGLVAGAAALLFLLTISVRLPRHSLLLEDDIFGVLHRGGGGGCLGPEGPGGAPRFCHLGLPPDDVAPLTSSGGSGSGSSSAADSGSGGGVNGSDSASSTGSIAGGGDSANGSEASGSSDQQQQQQRQHRLAVLIPYRDRQQHLVTLLAALRPYLEAQQRQHDVFVVEQGDDYLFNRGALLNAAALLLQGSSYDYYCFQDVDTIPLETGNIQYSYPTGTAPLHLTPHWLHPKSNFEDFLGGLLIMTAEQLKRVNGFGTQFWGWGREDDNMRERLVRAGMWPPEYPDVPREASRHSKRSYFKHQLHQQAEELRAEVVGGTTLYFQENPRLPYRGASIMSSQPRFLLDFDTGLNTTMFQLLSMQPFLTATKLTVRLYCNTTATPWCQPAAIGQRQAAEVKHAAAVHAVVGS